MALSYYFGQWLIQQLVLYRTSDDKTRVVYNKMYGKVTDKLNYTVVQKKTRQLWRTITTTQFSRF